MILFHQITGGVLGVIWLSRIVDAGFGMRKIADVASDRWLHAPSSSPRVSIIVPAKNEEASVGGVLRALAFLDYPNYQVLAIDDRSTDDTGARMEEVAAEFPKTLKILHIRELPEHWLGKTHAMWTAASHADGDWLLFTDADVFFRRDTLRRALSYAESENADHLVIFPTLVMHTVGERMMIAFFQTLFTFGHRPWKVADPDSNDHIGVGAFNLVRRSSYEAIGTYKALRMEVLDDMKLGKVIKNGGFAQRNVFGDGLLSIHWAKGAFGVISNFTKNFFAVMSFQWWRTVLAAAGLLFLNLGPFLGALIAPGWSRAGYLTALACMFALYAGMSTRTKISALHFLLHPVSTVLFTYALLRSMVVTLKEGGVTWRGTKYPLDDLRKGMV